MKHNKKSKKKTKQEKSALRTSRKYFSIWVAVTEYHRMEDL